MIFFVIYFAKSVLYTLLTFYFRKVIRNFELDVNMPLNILLIFWLIEF